MSRVWFDLVFEERFRLVCGFSLLRLGWRFSRLRSCKFLCGGCGIDVRVPALGSLGIFGDEGALEVCSVLECVWFGDLVGRSYVLLRVDEASKRGSCAVPWFTTYGFSGFFGKSWGAYAQSRRSWSSRLQNVYVSHRWLLELKVCSLVASVFEEVVIVLVAGMVPKEMVSGDFTSTLIR
ncbi:hypothetical protein Bca4012_037189 [Brassica carinata]